MIKNKITIISTFAEDRIFYAETKKTKASIGGPAFWITRTLKNLGANYILVSPKRRAIVEILASGGEETGSFVYVPKIKLRKKGLLGNFIVSTLGNEFDLKSILKLDGLIALDVQGYARSSRGKIKFPAGVIEKISILKTTKSELGKIPKKIVENQKSRILIVTNGKLGFEVFRDRKRYSFIPKIIKTKNTLGAGDVFLASFVVKYLKTRDFRKAALFAMTYTGKFLKDKK